MILLHYHPSSRTLLSKADRQITSKIIQARKLLDIKVLDHLIIAVDSYYSFKGSGHMI